MPRLTVTRERWPLATTFTIARGSKDAAEVVVAEIADGDVRGRGECVPYMHYGESVDGVIERIEGLTDAIAGGLDRSALQQTLPAGAARNALDCALWDLDAKRAGRRAWEVAGLPAPGPVTSAYTLSLDEPGRMREAAAAHRDCPLLKVKLGGEGDLERVAAVREGAPDARLIVDANEGWDLARYREMAPRLAALGVAMIEQPLPAVDDAALDGADRPVPLCADESCHDRTTLAPLAARYDLVNIKLDKTGGLTEALALAEAARAAGLGIMVGCMVATSLAMAPALLVAQRAAYVDLDGPLLLARDRAEGLEFAGTTIAPPAPALWG